MRIAVVTTQYPFIDGGAERHARNLVAALQERGFEATEVAIPFKSTPTESLVDHILAAKLIDLGDLATQIDLMIGLKFPAYLVRHPRKVFWVLHQHRAAYDQWETGRSDLLNAADGLAVRELIQEEDRRALGAPSARVFANSRNVAARLQRHLGLAAASLYHPPPNHERLGVAGYGDYLFAPSRLNDMKRQTLMIRALAHAPSAKLVIAGKPDIPSFAEELQDLARAVGVEGRLRFLGGISDDALVRHFAECRAVVYTPIDEDYGYVTLEAMMSSKAVITVRDSGGPLEFVRDESEGLVVEATVAALAAAFERVAQDRDSAVRWGAAARARYDGLGISWDAAIAALTGIPQTRIGAPPALDLNIPLTG